MGQEDALEEEMETHSSVLTWSARTEEPGGATAHRVAKGWTQLKQLSTHARASTAGWCGRRLLRAPRTRGRSNQSILKEIKPECSSEGWMLKLKLQCFDHLMQRANTLEETLMLGKIEGRRRRGTGGEMVGWRPRLGGHQFEQTL